jgi:hypothetical protein
MAKQIKIYSRTVIDDAGTLSRYEYNGSLTLDRDIEKLNATSKQQIAVAFDCFYDVLFVDDRNTIIPFRMEGY